MAHVSNKRFTVLFADDTYIFGTNNDQKTLIDNVNAELEKIINWLNANKLSRNIEKTDFILFRNKSKKFTNNYKVCMNNHEISEVNSKFLGVMINNQFNWKNHLDHICTKIAKTIGIILKARRILFKKHLTVIVLFANIPLPDILHSSVGRCISKSFE